VLQVTHACSHPCAIAPAAERQQQYTAPNSRSQQPQPILTGKQRLCGLMDSTVCCKSHSCARASEHHQLLPPKATQCCVHTNQQVQLQPQLYRQAALPADSAVASSGQAAAGVGACADAQVTKAIIKRNSMISFNRIWPLAGSGNSTYAFHALPPGTCALQAEHIDCCRS
jgi:hypothetical protein